MEPYKFKTYLPKSTAIWPVIGVTTIIEETEDRFVGEIFLLTEVLTNFFSGIKFEIAKEYLEADQGTIEDAFRAELLNQLNIEWINLNQQLYTQNKDVRHLYASNTQWALMHPIYMLNQFTSGAFLLGKPDLLSLTEDKTLVNFINNYKPTIYNRTKIEL